MNDRSIDRMMQCLRCLPRSKSTILEAVLQLRSFAYVCITRALVTCYTTRPETLVHSHVAYCCCSRYLQALDEEVLDVYLDISPLEMKAAMIESKVKEAIKNHTPKRDELAYYT